MKRLIKASTSGIGKKVYVVISGCYTDYSPVGVYSSIGKAKEVVKKEEEVI